MEEVIASRHVMKARACRYIILIGIMGLVLGAFFLVVKVLDLSPYPEDRQWVLILLSCVEFFAGTFAIIWGIRAFKKVNTPPELIVLKGSKLTFADGYCCDVKDIVNVGYRIIKFDTSGIGMLMIELQDRIIKYRQVQNVVQAHQRLSELSGHSF